MEDKHKEMLARLTARLAIGNADIRSDPIPHLQDAARLVSESRAVIEDVKWILSGMDSFDAFTDIAPTINPLDFNGEALIRIERAQKRIDDFFKQKACEKNK